MFHKWKHSCVLYGVKDYAIQITVPVNSSTNNHISKVIISEAPAVVNL